MSTAAKPDPGTAVALRDAAVGNLPIEVQHQLELRKLTNQVAGELAKLNWGSKLDLATRRAIADWGQQFRVDPTTEIHVLGGNVYLNAAFYLRQLSELIAAGLVEYAYADHVEDDARLKQLGPEGEGEFSRRLRERIKHQVPDKAASAVVFRVKLRSMEQEVTGTKWCGNGTKKNDPVGDATPVETSESRAARRAMRLLSSHVPAQKAHEIEAIEHSAEALSTRVDDARRRIAAQEASWTRPKSLPVAVDPADPYRVNADAPDQAPRDVLGEVVSATPTDAHRAARAAAANLEDPYADDAGADDALGATLDLLGDAADISEAPPLSAPTRQALACEAYAIPAGLGPKSGTSLGSLSTPDLEQLYRWASKPNALKNYPDLAHNCEELLESRRNGEATEPRPA